VLPNASMSYGPGNFEKKKVWILGTDLAGNGRVSESR